MKTDAQLHREVLDELERDPTVDATRIGVSVKDGVVALTGSVPVYGQKFRAQEVVTHVHGVKGIANDIEVRVPDGLPPNDADIAASVLHALKWEAKVPDDQVQVIVRDGWITLEGTVDQQSQKDAIDRAVTRLIGARGLTDLILVKSGSASPVLDVS
jgi:osmotically-inducible protein OsmY